VPIISCFVQRITGKKSPLPQVHIAIVKYGDRPDSLTVERWFYRGGSLWSAYDTTQVFRDDYAAGVFEYLPPWYHFGRARTRWGLKNIMRLTHIHFRKYSLALLLAAGVGLGAALATWQAARASAEREELAAIAASEVVEAAPASEASASAAPAPWIVLGEWSVAPSRWLAWVEHGGVEYHLDDLAASGWSVSRIAPCAYRLASLTGAAAVARCRRERPPAQAAGFTPAAEQRPGN